MLFIKERALHHAMQGTLLQKTLAMAGSLGSHTSCVSTNGNENAAQKNVITVQATRQ